MKVLTLVLNLVSAALCACFTMVMMLFAFVGTVIDISYDYSSGEMSSKGTLASVIDSVALILIIILAIVSFVIIRKGKKAGYIISQVIILLMNLASFATFIWFFDLLSDGPAAFIGSVFENPYSIIYMVGGTALCIVAFVTALIAAGGQKKVLA